MSALDNKRIAKNTLLLYIRMLLIMGVTLYTSRVVLRVLGIEDFGTYNLVGGFVSMFAVISNALVIATQRYYNVALGQNDNKRFTSVFLMSMNVMLFLSIIVLIVSEVAGIYFINNYLNIPPGRELAANIVFQFSIFSFIINLIRTPYHAAIIAHEKMSFYAYVSIIEVILKLAVVFLLDLFNADKLILYAVLSFLAVSFITYLFKLYTNKNLNTCRYRLYWDKDLFKELLSFSSYSLIGQSGVVVNSQGQQFLINRFYSVAVNAASGIQGQVIAAITSFTNSFQTAFNPQLTKTFAGKELKAHYNLLYRSSKFSFYLVLILALPIIFNTEIVLNAWLTAVPPYTTYFIIFGIISRMIGATSAPLATSILAHGSIKKYQISLFLFNIIGLLLTFIALWRGAVPYVTSIMNGIVQVLLLISRLYFANRLTGLNVKAFFYKVIMPILIVSSVSSILPYYTSRFANSFVNFIFIFIINIIATSMIIYFTGLSKQEKIFVKSSINKLRTQIKK